METPPFSDRNPIPVEIEAAWKAEIDRRLAQVEAGTVELIPGEIVSAEINKLLDAGRK